MAGIHCQEGDREQHAGQDDQEQRDPVDGQQPLDAQVGNPVPPGNELQIGTVPGVEGSQQPHGHGTYHRRGGNGHQLEQLGSATRKDGHYQGTHRRGEYQCGEDGEWNSGGSSQD